MKSELSILIPVYNGDCRRQVEALSRQAEAIGGLRYEIIVADDGSPDRSCVESCREVEHWPHCRFIDRGVNSGSAATRNFLARESKYKWLLFLDCDMEIECDRFILRYLEGDHQGVVNGGIAIGAGDKSNLRYLYETERAPHHTAEERNKRPYQSFRSANFLIEREVMLRCPFDERFKKSGYEDVMLGKQLRRKSVRMLHIDNPNVMTDFEDNSAYVSKIERSLRTLHQFRDELRGYSKLLTLVGGIHLAPVRWTISLWHLLFGSLERRLLCSSHPSLTLFKLYKLGYYLSLEFRIKS